VGWVIGTAGHVDHGKSSLVKALTGIDPDRLKEEKARSMTIDLGFAYLKLPSGRTASVVDVPGHSRFVHNMLAGVHGFDVVLLVIAADEGVMPQTREHMEIIDLFQVQAGVVALTKADLVEDDWIEFVQEDLRDFLKDTQLRDAPVISVSSITGAGLDELKDALDVAIDKIPPRVDLDRPRLPVDRRFSVKGFGTVVTGTLLDGRIRLDDELEVQPGGGRVRVRGLQQHNVAVDEVLPGSRVAINLSGADAIGLRRGHVLARQGTIPTVHRADGRIKVLAGSPFTIKNGDRLTVHIGTTETEAKVIVLGSQSIERQQSAWVQLHFRTAVAAVPGDRFILRRQSPMATVGGGVLLDVTPRRHHRLDNDVLASLERRGLGRTLAEELRKYPLGATQEQLLRTAYSDPSVQAQLLSLDAIHVGELLFHPDAWESLKARVVRDMNAFHRAHPTRLGMAASELQSRLGTSPSGWQNIMPRLVAEGVVQHNNDGLFLPSHKVAGQDARLHAVARLVEVLSDVKFRPPALSVALRAANASEDDLYHAVRQGRVVRLNREYAFTQDAYAESLTIIRSVFDNSGSISISQAREALDSSRRPVLALLEYLDAQRITRCMDGIRYLR
jgi:selenocysteine-specific elongation factor